jgi:hypothetical protein
MSGPQNRLPVSSEQDLSGQTLEVLAARVREAHAAVQATETNALARALDAGDALLELQVELRDRGFRWQAWLREKGWLPLSTAKLYVQLANHRDEIEAARADFPELSIRAARRFISKPAKFKPSMTPTSAPVVTETTGPVAAESDTRVQDDLEHHKRRLEIENIGLRSELEEAKAARPLDARAWAKASPADRQRFLGAIGRVGILAAVPEGWGLERHMLGALANEKFLGEFKRRLPAKLWQKHQATLKAIITALDPPESAGPTLDLVAIPIDGATTH